MFPLEASVDGFVNVEVVAKLLRLLLLLLLLLLLFLLLLILLLLFMLLWLPNEKVAVELNAGLAKPKPDDVELVEVFVSSPKVKPSLLAEILSNPNPVAGLAEAENASSEALVTAGVTVLFPKVKTLTGLKVVASWLDDFSYLDELSSLESNFVLEDPKDLSSMVSTFIIDDDDEVSPKLLTFL